MTDTQERIIKGIDLIKQMSDEGKWGTGIMNAYLKRMIQRLQEEVDGVIGEPEATPEFADKLFKSST